MPRDVTRSWALSNGHPIILTTMINTILKTGKEMQRWETVPAFSYSIRDDVINGQFPLRLRKAHELLMTLPKVHKQAKRRQPRFIHGKVKLCDAVI